jgi:hypothetical protein
MLLNAHIEERRTSMNTNERQLVESGKSPDCIMLDGSVQFHKVFAFVQADEKGAAHD